MSTHPIDSELMDRIVKYLEFVSSEHAQKTFISPNLAKDIQRDINELNQERDWVVISVLHPGRLAPEADDPNVRLAWEALSEIADNVSNNQQYDDALNSAIEEAWDRFLEDRADKKGEVNNG
jgi:hypothetical protein